jgi:hypothetical protein
MRGILIKRYAKKIKLIRNTISVNPQRETHPFCKKAGILS